MYRNEEAEWDVAEQIFAGDISVAISHADPKKLARMEWTFSEVIHKILIDHDLETAFENVSILLRRPEGYLAP